MIWLIGNKGMLGYEVERLLKGHKLNYLASDKEVDVCDYEALENYGQNRKINWIINCSGYTQVDKAEEEKEMTFKINRDGVRNIVRLSLEKQAKLIHISTDYVFSGEKEGFLGYTEDDEPNPINTYGESKLAGEKEIIGGLKEYFIIRTAWLYGLKGNNFVYTILRLCKEREVIKVVDDQFGSPTYALDLAEVILKIIKDNSSGYGIYHFTNEGVTNWYGFARVIYEKAKSLNLLRVSKRVEIREIKTEDYPTAARRPRHSILSKDKIKKEFNLKIRDWEESLVDFLNILSRQIK